VPAFRVKLGTNDLNCVDVQGGADWNVCRKYRCWKSRT